ncbi:MAG: aminopeptidase P family protein [Candidatus Omnitrophica bacterium]|nr:aminopeptidase P family protein [Candidatus Omnitrophota bacterium]
MPDRLKKFQDLLASHRLDCYILTSDTNIRYLTNFPASESLLIVFPTKSVYLTDSRYTEEAKIGLKGVIVEQFTHNMTKTMFDIIVKNTASRVGFDDRHLSLNRFRLFEKECPKGVELVRVNHLVEAMRETKEKSEVDQIRKCLTLNLAAYKYLKSVIKPGLTEKDVLLKLENYVRSKGAGFSFDPIIASGPNSAFPHARVTDRKIRKNEPVLVDMGIDIKGYKSDLTRMFFLGKMPSLYTKVYAAVEEAQKRGIAKIRAGVKAADVDAAARNYLESLDLAKYFGHSLGHGVGLDIHEDPRLSAQSGATLREGMIITVEPGVYLPGQFGIRLEEMVFVKKSGCEVISRPR